MGFPLQPSLKKPATLLTLIRLALRASHLPPRGRQGTLRAQGANIPPKSFPIYRTDNLPVHLRAGVGACLTTQRTVTHKKTRGTEVPLAPALAVPHPIMTCTKWQVGCRSRRSLLPASTARRSVGGRSAIPPGSLTSRFKNVGPKGHDTHQAGKKLIRRPLPHRGHP